MHTKLFALLLLLLSVVLLAQADAAVEDVDDSSFDTDDVDDFIPAMYVWYRILCSERQQQ